MLKLPDTPETRMRAAMLRMVAARDRQPTIFFRPLIMELWTEFEGWYRAARHDAAESRRIADLALAVMTDYAGLPDADVGALCKPETGWNVLSDKVAIQIAEQVRRDKSAVNEKHPGLAALAAERAARASQFAARFNAERVTKAIAEADAAPARLLAKLRAEGIHLAFERDRITLPSGCQIGARDREMVAEYKPALLKLLAAEVAAARPVVIA